jgi:acid phosphatase
VRRCLPIAAAVLTAIAAVLLPATGASAAATRVSKVLVFIEENHSLAQMRTGMPYTFSLAKRYGYATHYRAITHPSLPNYLAIASGSTHGVTDDKAPGVHRIDARTVFGQAFATGHTAKTYAESAAGRCDMQGTSLYAVRHNPWLYFTPTAERSLCRTHDVPLGSAFAHDVAAGTLPNVGLVVPNLCNDAHNCSLATADGWFRQQMQKVFAGPDWASGRLAVILTADESTRADASNTVLTVVIHRSQSGHVVTTPLTHYSLTRLCEDVVHAGHLGTPRSAPSMSAAFGLPIA